MSSFRVRGVRAACLSLACVLVSASAIAGGADYFLKIEGVDGESKDDKHKGEIEIQSFSWGATQMGSGGGGGLGAGKVNVQDISVMRGPRQTTSVDGVGVAAGDVDPVLSKDEGGDGHADAAAGAKFGAVSGVRRDDGLAGAKRTHPGMMKISKPLETGSMTLKMKLPGCAVGKRYPSAELTTPAGRFALQDLVVASCGGGGSGDARPMEEVTLNYSKVQVRGWDPNKKEEVVGKAR